MQHNVAYATRICNIVLRMQHTCRICNTMLRMRHAIVAYATVWCACDMCKGERERERERERAKEDVGFF